MSAEAYTLILTQGVHVVRPDVASAIRDAIESGAKIVDIEIDLFGPLESRRRTSIVTAHVVALVEAQRSTRAIVAESGGKIRTIR